jgi:hypothetical protein
MLCKQYVPFKTKIFLWFLHRKEILTKDNLIKRNWQECKKMLFCDQDEIMQKKYLEYCLHAFQYYSTIGYYTLVWESAKWSSQI